MSTEDKNQKIPDKRELEKALLTMLKETAGDPILLRSHFLGLSKHFPKWYGAQGALTVLKIFDELVSEQGIDPQDLLPRPVESRAELLERIRRIGEAELGAVRNAKNLSERRLLIRRIEQQVVECADPDDVSFAYEHLRIVFRDLEFYDEHLPPLIDSDPSAYR